MLDDLNILEQFRIDEFINDFLNFNLIKNDNLNISGSKFKNIVFLSNSCNTEFELAKVFLKSEGFYNFFNLDEYEFRNITQSLVIVDSDVNFSVINNSSNIYIKFSNKAKKTLNTSNMHEFSQIINQLVSFGILKKQSLIKLESVQKWIQQEAKQWLPSQSLSKNLAKQIALMSVGKTNLFITDNQMETAGIFFKINFNKYAKNLSFNESLSELAKNNVNGWLSHPVHKPYAIFDIIPKNTDKKIFEMFYLKNRLLSGRMPASFQIDIKGDDLFEKCLYSYYLSKIASGYLACLNKQNPNKMDLTLRFRNEF